MHGWDFNLAVLLIINVSRWSPGPLSTGLPLPRLLVTGGLCLLLNTHRTEPINWRWQVGPSLDRATRADLQTVLLLGFLIGWHCCIWQINFQSCLQFWNSKDCIIGNS